MSTRSIRAKNEDLQRLQLACLVDTMLARYIDWREDAAAAAEAYSRWCQSPADERAWRFSAYLAALEQEESTANGYASVVADLEVSLPVGPICISQKGVTCPSDS